MLTLKSYLRVTEFSMRDINLLKERSARFHDISKPLSLCTLLCKVHCNDSTVNHCFSALSLSPPNQKHFEYLPNLTHPGPISNNTQK